MPEALWHTEVMTEVAVITGLSGAGRSTAAGAFEDLGWFVIDNLPAALVPKVAELAGSNSGRYEKVALAMAGFDRDMEAQVDALRGTLGAVSVIFLEASAEVLVRRYESTKRRHPLADDKSSLIDAIAAEQRHLAAARAAADLVIDTSELNPHQLRERLTNQFGTEDEDDSMRITVSSFGYKHGLPLDVDLVLDCRFLPNPHWEADLRPLTGKDKAIQEYVLDRDVAHGFTDSLMAMLDHLLPAYTAEGKSYLGIAFGCTGGRHRSVAVAEEVARILGERGWNPNVRHRDIAR